MALPFSICAAVTCGFARIAAAVARAYSASNTGCVSDFVPTKIKQQITVTTTIGRNQFPFCLRAKTSLGDVKMSMKSSHMEGAFDAAVAVIRVSDQES